jgi:hypothetical protein
MNYDLDEIQLESVACPSALPILGMWAQMMLFAADDMHYGLKRGWSIRNCPDNATSADFRSAYLWMHDWDDGRAGSFSWVCDLFDFDPDRVRSKAMTNTCRIELAKYVKKPKPQRKAPHMDLIPQRTFSSAELMVPGKPQRSVYKMIHDWVDAGLVEQLKTKKGNRYRPCKLSTPLETESATSVESEEESLSTTTPARKSGKRSTLTTSGTTLDPQPTST